MFETAQHPYVHPVASQEQSVKCAGYPLKLNATAKHGPAVVRNGQRKLRLNFLGGKSTRKITPFVVPTLLPTLLPTSSKNDQSSWGEPVGVAR